MTVHRTSNRRYRTNRAKVLEGQPVCALCGRAIDKTLPQYHPDSGTAHHYPVPYSKGGSDELSNLVPAHLECNQKQGDKLDPVIDRTSREWI